MTRTLRILHVEDQERDVALLTRHLTRAGYQINSQRVDTAEAMRQALESAEWDVILCDYSMPRFNALLALSVLKETGLDIPLIIISGTIGEEVAVQAMRSGASDYLMKDNLVRLAPTIERELQEAENRRARQRAEMGLRQSEAEYRRLLDTSSEGIWVVNAELQTTYANQRLAEMIGVRLEELIGRSALDFMNATNTSTDAEVEQRWRRRQLGTKEQYDLYFRRRDGSVLWALVSTSPIYNERGEFIGALSMLTDITERKRVEEKLRESEGILRLFVEHAPAAIAMFDCQMRYLAVSRRWLQDYQIVGDVIGRNHYEVSPDVPEKWRQVHQRCLAGAVEKSDEEYFVRADGSAGWLKWEVHPWHDAAGNIGGIILFTEDVTERKRAEEVKAQLSAQVESQRQRLNNIIDNVPGNVWEEWLEPDPAAQRINFTSDYIETMTGYSVAEWFAVPNFWLEIVHPEDRERVERSITQGLSSGTGGTLEFRWVAKDGHAVWVEARTVIITDDEGRPIGVRGVTMDITERKRAEQELKQSEERYRDLVENAHDIIYSHDLQGNYISVNQAGERITGYTQEESLKMNLAQTVAPEYLEKARQMIASKLAGEPVTAYDLEIIAKDGRRIAIEVNTRIMYQEGAAVGVQGIARDVTERKQLEAQLRQSQKMEAVGQLAGGVAHDFNNLLTAITGYSELTIRKLKAEDPLRHNIEEIKRAGERAAGLTRQLLAFSRKQVLQPKVLDLNGVVSEMEKMLHRLIGEDIDLQTVLRRELGRIKADPGQVEQVLMNLVVNARDAMPQGGRLTIETENVYLSDDYARQHIAVKPGPYVMLAVSDTGTGIDEETRARIFEPFFTTKEAGRGTGLGLSTVYGIVKQSGGNIWVYSEIGQGTTFKVYLPRVDEGIEEQQRGAELDEGLHGTETILLAEDEEMVRKLAREVLEMFGYRVLEAANGGAALLICERHQGEIQLLLTDVVMPEMSGRELADRLTELRPEMRVLYMSGYTDNAIVHQGVLDADTNFIQKPFAPEALVRKIRKVLDKGEA